MPPVFHASTTSARPAGSAGPWYLSIPRHLLTDLHNSPLAIGIYGLAARLYLITRAPVPLSRDDLLRYDPSLKPGAVKRALDRLRAGGWLIQSDPAGKHKHRYQPSWGMVKRAPCGWDLNAACHGRPRHIQRLLLDQKLFDICMGKLTPHATLPAPITRYLTTPALTLSDIGCYALTLIDLPRPTRALEQLGLVRHNQAHQLPSEQRLLALLSQQTLLASGTTPASALTHSGTRRLGVAAPTPGNPHEQRSQPLFFVPPALIGTVIVPLIGSLIGSAAAQPDACAAPRSAAAPETVAPRGITWETQDNQQEMYPPPTPPAHNNGGGGTDMNHGSVRRSRSDRQPELVIPETEAARLLQSIHMLPAQIIECAGLPIATIHAAIADGRSRPGVRDLAAWVVTLLRTHRDTGWAITPPPPRADSPDDLRATFARYAAEQDAARAAEAQDVPLTARDDAAPRTLPAVWEAVQADLAAQMPRAEYQQLIADLTLVGIADGVVTLHAPSLRAKDAIEARYSGRIRMLLQSYTDQVSAVRVILAAQPAAAADLASAPVTLNQAQIEQRGRPAWITAAAWAARSPLCRAALVGATDGVDGVTGRTPALTAVLATRFAGEIAALRACMVQPADQDTDRASEPRAQPHSGACQETPPAAPPAPPNLDACPCWIAAPRWVTLPVMLRAALMGAQLIDSIVHGRTPYHSRLLASRYRREVAELVATVPSPGSVSG